MLDAALETARARGERRMVLEVIEQNAPARALYERSGFTLTRRLVGLRAAPVATESSAALEERQLDDFVRAYVAEADADLPWQLAPATIAAAALPSRAFALGLALALVDVAPAALVVRAMVVARNARREGHATQLVRALRAKFADRALRIVPIVPEVILGDLASRIGADLDPIAQLELAREL